MPPGNYVVRGWAAHVSGNGVERESAGDHRRHGRRKEMSAAVTEPGRSSSGRCRSRATAVCGPAAAGTPAYRRVKRRTSFPSAVRPATARSEAWRRRRPGPRHPYAIGIVVTHPLAPVAAQLAARAPDAHGVRGTSVARRGHASGCPGTSCFSSLDSWNHGGTVRREVLIRAPDLGDAPLRQEDEARGIHVRQLVAAESVEHPAHRTMVVGVERQQCESRQIGQCKTERACGLLAQPVEEPATGLRNDRRRGALPPRRIGKEADDGPADSSRRGRGLLPYH
jgi:hypothetical protein